MLCAAREARFHVTEACTLGEYSGVLPLAEQIPLVCGARQGVVGKMSLWCVDGLLSFWNPTLPGEANCVKKVPTARTQPAMPRLLEGRLPACTDWWIPG